MLPSVGVNLACLSSLLSPSRIVSGASHRKYDSFLALDNDVHTFFPLFSCIQSGHTCILLDILMR
jgi:hypothetical protein